MEAANKKGSHENIVRFAGKRFVEHSQAFMILMEYCDGGELFDYIGNFLE